MFFKKKTAVYQSSDEEDFNLAKSLLEKEQIRYYEYAAEEMPVAGCGARIHPARLNKQINLMTFRISVASENIERAILALQGKVRFVLSSSSD
ncbi:hypothetical protein [Succinivibrio sp.]|jgi:hypothetical protein|uniref:hypothetical protein n=1 Tax=Succinivibrio sp. TaxID=2053619 RepID=UPI00387029BD